MRNEQDDSYIEETVNKLLGYIPQFTVEELQIMTEVCAQWCLNGRADGNRRKY